MTKDSRDWQLTACHSLKEAASSEKQGKDEHHTWKGVETKYVYCNFNCFITIAETLFYVLTNSSLSLQWDMGYGRVAATVNKE